MIAIIEAARSLLKIAQESLLLSTCKNGGGVITVWSNLESRCSDLFIHQGLADNEACVARLQVEASTAQTGLHRIPYEKAAKGQKPNPQVALKLLARELAKLKEVVIYSLYTFSTLFKTRN